jgi:class 3 adenylate cyclase/tetratricopeptide (TPR) repeat protein
VRDSGGRIQGERRVVTILFCDVEGSTALAEKLDPEDVMEIMNGAFEVLVAPVYRYEGTLARLMGDAVLAFFGAPIAHEDDPSRACRAALEIVEAAGKYARNLERKRGIAGFDVRVGINTGLVVVGEVGSDLRVEYTAMGDAVNLAARMEGAAEPGTILITERTRRLIGPLFETRSLGPIQVKGKEEPVLAHRVLGPRLHSRVALGPQTPLVDRKSELKTLGKAIGDLGKGRGGVVGIAGDAGTGKSRLLAEARGSGAKGTVWIEGRCTSYTEHMQYSLAQGLLQGLVDAAPSPPGSNPGSVLRKRVSALWTAAPQGEGGSRGPSAGEAATEAYGYLAFLLDLPLDILLKRHLELLKPESLRANMHRAFTEFVRRLAGEEPVVLVCEDLQWIDPSSLELLRSLASVAREAPLLLLLSFRSEGGSATGFLRELRAESGGRYRQIETAPLGRADTARLLTQLLGPVPVTPSAFEHLVAHSEGLPYFLVEIVQWLLDTPHPEGSEGPTLDERRIKERGIPATLHGAVLSRIDSLEPREKRVLQAASVIGRAFPRPVLASIARKELTDDELELSLDELVRRGFLRTVTGPDSSTASGAGASPPCETPLWSSGPLKAWREGEVAPVHPGATSPVEYLFARATTAEIVYGSLLRSQRRLLHARAAEAFEEVFGERRAEVAPLLAFHFEKAGDIARARERFILAARRASRVCATAEAVACYRRALGLDAPDEEVDRSRAVRTGEVDNALLHEELGDVLFLQSRYPEAVEQYGAAMSEREEGDPRRVVLTRKQARVHAKWGRHEEAGRLYEAALAQMAGAEDPLEAARIYSGLGLASCQAGEIDRALQMGDRALSLMKNMDDRRGVAETTCNLGTLLLKKGDLDAAFGYHSEALSIWEELEDPYGLATCHNNLGLLASRRGRFEEARAHYLTSIEYFEKLGNRHGLARVHDNLGQLCQDHGLEEEALTHLEKAVTILAEISVGSSEVTPEMWESGAW